MRVLIVGCGYVGLPLGVELMKQGHDVFGLRRSAAGQTELTATGIKPLVADITNPSDLSRLSPTFAWVVNTVSSSKGGVDEYRDVYLHGTRNLVHWLGPAPLEKFVYTSSTSLYGQTDGSVVTETSATEPGSETSRLLVETENLLLEAARKKRFPAVILRAAGIYGPGRGHLFQQYLRDEARIAGQGQRFLNMIHRDDLVNAIVAALQSGTPGQIYNAVDDEPVTQLDFFRWLAAQLDKEMPPFSSEQGTAPRKRGLSNKRVSNHKLKAELGVPLKYPTFRDGYAVEIAARPKG